MSGLNSFQTLRLRSTVAIAAIGTLCALSACGFVGGSSDKDTLVFGGFGGSLETAMEEEVIPAFEEKYDVDVTYVTGTSDELLAKAKSDSSGMDVIWTNDSTHHTGKAEDVFAELDPDVVGNLDDVYPAAIDPDNIGVATGMQALGLVYNTEVFEEQGWEPPDSWMDLWDDRFDGHVVGYNIPIGYANLLLVQAAIMNGGSPTDLEPGWSALEELAPEAAAWVSPPAQLDSLLSDGTAWLAYNGSSRAYAAQAADVPVDFVYPKEGAIAYPQYFDVVESAPHPELAQKFVDFALEESSQVGMAEVAMMGPVNRKVKLSDDVAATVPYGEPAIGDLQFLETDHLNATLDDITDRWTRLVGEA
ncbi:MAG: ABC transporter substrate-binding protein [Nocardioidaceae bacterium]